MTKPIKNAVLEESPEYLVRFPDGRVRRDAEVSISEEEFDQLAKGYMCANCYEPLRSPYPEICPLPGCGFHVKRDQQAYLEEHFGGKKWLGPSESTLAYVNNELDKLWLPKGAGNARNGK